MDAFRARVPGGGGGTASAGPSLGTKRPNPSDWKPHFDIKTDKGGGSYDLVCLYCRRGEDKAWNSNAVRAKHHLAGTGNGVAACKHVPQDVRDTFKAVLGGREASRAVPYCYAM
eukprot:TRINITY_DN6329_c0_g1_i1.p3 TRINITY_DN6329_c0_g1~~TRINITY_DN6329_c0_g1_i1.p3  ORF type:complete len:114 (+),score=15.40 TRINITY_DN6329_c0_g1_i1:57-398(+)